ncbi:hypothetical protein JCM3774_002630 [Rhodotorula dairenensis]
MATPAVSHGSVDAAHYDEERVLSSTHSGIEPSGGEPGPDALVFESPTQIPTASFESRTESAGASRAPRPASLYVPLDAPETPATPDVALSEPVTSPSSLSSWPFDRGVGGSTSLGVHSPFVGPLSPSEIHPSYADSPSAPLLHHSPPTPTEPPQNLYSAIPMSEISDRDPAAFASAAALGGARSSSPLYGSKAPRGVYQPRAPGTNGLLAPHRADDDESFLTRLARDLDNPKAWLVLYFMFNLGLTLFNKLVLQGFPFAWTLTAIQMLSGTIGTQIALHRGAFTQAHLTTKENGIMIMFSGLYTINIAVSNLSLGLVSVPFHQVVRAMTPLFTIMLSMVLFRKRHSRQTYLSLIPVVAGVAFATYGDYSFTAWGFILTLTGAILASLKTIITNRVQVGRLKLHPLDLLVRMSPLAFMQCVFFGWWSGELERVRVYGATEMTRQKAIALAINGAIAFGLNVVSFTANKKTSALTMTVAANVKQVLTIVLAVVIFNFRLNPTNLLGITLTLAGGAWYARVELQEKSARAAAAAQAPLTPVVPSEVKLG